MIKALEQKVSSSEMQLTAVKKGRSIGTRSAIDVLNAEHSYSVALRDYKNTLYDNVLKNILLKNAAGVLGDDTSMLSLSADNGGKITHNVSKPLKAADIVFEHQTIGSSVGVLQLAPLNAAEIDFYVAADTKARRSSVCSRATLPTLFDGSGTKRSNSSTVVVLDKQENWLKVACNPNNEFAWIAMKEGWKYLAWKEYLKNKKIEMLPKLNPDNYNIYDAEEKSVLMTLKPKDSIEVFSVIENWALVKLNKTQIGWLRWKDNQGRILVAVTQ
jgi:hypothetical protein